MTHGKECGRRWPNRDTIPEYEYRDLGKPRKTSEKSEGKIPVSTGGSVLLIWLLRAISFEGFEVLTAVVIKRVPIEGYNVRFEVLSAMVMKSSMFLDIRPCSL
jgi:hypothetical protein